MNLGQIKMFLTDEQIKEANFKRVNELRKSAISDLESIDIMACLLDFKEGATFARDYYEQNYIMEPKK